MMVLERKETIRGTMTVGDFLRIARPDPRAHVIPLGDREGVYVHSFICRNMVKTEGMEGEGRLCNLHFVVFSWKADRHRAGTVACPECGGRERFIHWRAVLSESPKMKLIREDEPATEIYSVFPFPGSNLLNDTKG